MIMFIFLMDVSIFDVSDEFNKKDSLTLLIDIFVHNSLKKTIINRYF